MATINEKDLFKENIEEQIEYFNMLMVSIEELDRGNDNLDDLFEEEERQIPT